MDLQIAPNQVVGLPGPSGAGKSTLLNIIGCITEPSSGWMCLDGDVVYDRRWLHGNLRRLRLRKVGFIFQFHNLLRFLSSLDNVAVVPHLAGEEERRAGKRAEELLEYLEVDHRKDAFPANLSGGEARWVAIARALANRPRIILADEPTAALDSERARIVMEPLRKVAVDQQAAILAVTHDDKILDRLDHIHHLRDGRLAEPSAEAATAAVRDA